MKIKWIISLGVSIIFFAYFGIYLFLYSIKDDQSNRFKSYSIPSDFHYSFQEPFEEITFATPDGGTLTSVLFKADSSKGVICFWKGNGGTIKEWAEHVPSFLTLRYDIIITDYRQNGKSKGDISLQNFYSDAQTVYDSLKGRYPENRIVIAGFSLGGRIAANLAANNTPRMTVLVDAASTTGDFSDRFFEALYFPLPSINPFLFTTDEDVKRASSPIIIICTDNQNSLSHTLKPWLSAKDEFFEIKGATHNTIMKHPETHLILSTILSKGLR